MAKTKKKRIIFSENPIGYMEVWIKNHHTVRKYAKYFVSLIAVSALGVLATGDISPLFTGEFWFVNVGTPFVLALQNYIKHNGTTLDGIK